MNSDSTRNAPETTSGEPQAAGDGPATGGSGAAGPSTGGQLPAPDREYRFAAMAVGGTGAGVKERLRKARLRDWRFDFAWPDQMVALEMDGGGFVGGGHNRGAGMRNDCEKLSTAVAMGWSVLRVTSDHVKSGQAVDWIGKALEIRS